MALSDSNAKALFLDLHQTINDYSEATSEEIFGSTITEPLYPPNTEFTEAEKAELAKLAGNSTLKTALQKIIADSSSTLIFHLFNHIDGTTDPQGEWTGVSLTDHSENNEPAEMLHDKFFETYWGRSSFIINSYDIATLNNYYIK